MNITAMEDYFLLGNEDILDSIDTQLRFNGITSYIIESIEGNNSLSLVIPKAIITNVKDNGEISTLMIDSPTKWRISNNNISHCACVPLETPNVNETDHFKKYPRRYEFRDVIKLENLKLHIIDLQCNDDSRKEKLKPVDPELPFSCGFEVW